MYTYDESKNDGKVILGVPLRDLDADDLSRLSEAQLAAVTVALFYIKVEPMAEPKAEPKGDAVAPAPSKGKESK